MKQNAPERDRIRLVRLITGDTQAAIAARIGISGKVWSGYERGNHVPRETVWLLLDRLGLSPDWVWFGLEGNLSQAWRDKITAATKEPKMARRKEPPKPMSSLRHDFVASLENVCNEAMMLLQAVDTVLQHDTNLKPGVRDILKERSAAMRAALLSEQ